MTQADTILALLREAPKSLQQIAAHPAGIFYEFRSRVSELRQQGYVIVHHKVKHCKACEVEWSGVRCPAMERGEDVYRLEAEPANVGADGQLLMAL